MCFSVTTSNPLMKQHGKPEVVSARLDFCKGLFLWSRRGQSSLR